MTYPSKWLRLGCIALAIALIACPCVDQVEAFCYTLVDSTVDPVAASQEDDAQQDATERVERFPLLSLEQAQAAIETQPGFAIELVASEPLIASPVAMQFDRYGDLWVVEMLDYSEQENESLGRVSRLFDDDHDGAMDRSEVIASGLSWPTAIACFQNRVWIAAPPLLLELSPGASTNAPWSSRSLLEGFGRQNVQGLANSFRWGLDGRMHLATSSNGGRLIPSPGSVFMSGIDPTGRDVSGRDVSFRAGDGSLSTCVGYGQHGMDFTAWGDKLVTSNSDHLQQVVAWYLPELTDASLSKNIAWRRSIASDGPQAEVYRSSPVESWRVLRTQMRLSGASPGLLEGEGRASGYFTSATGVTVYDGDQWHANNESMAFIADVGSNLVHRKQLRAKGIGLVGERIDSASEFIRSRDTWFRPVQFSNGPDGCLYIVDMARETIEHPKSFPDAIKRQVDLTSGRDLGRIWCVRSTDHTVRRESPELKAMSISDWIATLDHPNGWHRETACQALIECNDAAAIPALREMVRDHPSSQARLGALSVLSSLPDGLDTETWFASLCDEHPKIRLWGLIGLPLLGDQVSVADRARGILQMEKESDLEVRMVAAVRSASVINDPAQRAHLLLGWIGQDWDCEELRTAVELASAGESAEFIWTEWIASDRIRLVGQTDEAWLDAILFQLHASNVLPDMLAEWCQKPLPDATTDCIMASFGRLRQRRALTQPETVQALEIFARQVLLPRWEGLFVRNASGQFTINIPSQASLHGLIQGLANLSSLERRDLLDHLLSMSAPIDLLVEAMDAWVHSEPVLQSWCAAHWKSLPPPASQVAMRSLLGNATGADLLCDLLDAEQLSPAAIPAAGWQTLRALEQPSLRQRISKWESSPAIPWETIAAAYRERWTQPGSAEKGQVAFQRWCAACHQVRGIGTPMGPSLDSYRVRANDAIAIAIAEPNRDMDPKFEQHQIRTKDGDILVGLFVNSDRERIRIRTAQNQTIDLPMDEVDVWTSTGRSLMPEGLLTEIDPATLNDLIAFLRSGR